jgi:putative ABC transport system permease protein
MWRVVLRTHQRHRMRLVLVCLAIAVGVAFLAATFILTDTDQNSIASTAQQAYGGVSVAVEGNFSTSYLPGLGRHTPLRQSLLARVSRVPGVAQAQGEVEGYAQLVGSHGALIGGAATSALGISTGSVPSLRAFVLASGRLPDTPGQVVVDANTFAEEGWHLGQVVRIVTQQPVQRFRVVGVIRSRQSTDVLGSTLVGFDPATAQRLLGESSHFNVILATAVRGIPPTELAARVSAAIGQGAEVLTGSEFVDQSELYSAKGAPTFSTVLDVVLGLALFVGALVIVNIISIMVASRRKELALLRCLGATRAQIYRSVLVEGAAMGLLASAVGLCLGIVAASFLRSTVTSPGAQTSATGLVVTPGTVLLCLVVGTVITALASLLPAMTASRIPPVSALRQDVMGQVAEAPSGYMRAGLVLSAAGLAIVAVGLFVDQGDQVEIWVVGAGLALGLIGMGRLSPLIVPPLVTVLGWPLERLSGLSGQLGRQNATRNARRTVATATALVVGVALVSVLAIMVTSAQGSDNSQVNQALTADFEVLHAGSGPLSSGPSNSQPISPDVLTRLRAQPGLVVSPYSFVTFLLQGRYYGGAAADPATIQRMFSFGAVQGSMAALNHGGFAAASQLAAQTHLHVGEMVHLSLLSQVQVRATSVLRLDAIYPQGNFALGGFLFPTATVSRLDRSLGLSAVLVKAAPGVSHGQAGQAVTGALAGYSDLSVQDLAQVRAAEDQNIAGQINLISILLVLAIVVAVLGIVNTLALSVTERARELALLRAVGMTRPQIRAMVLSEAALIGVVGALMGVMLGLFLGWAFQRALSSSQGITELVVPWTRLAIYVVAGAATGVIAGTLPARRAAQVDMLAAIASE